VAVTHSNECTYRIRASNNRKTKAWHLPADPNTTHLIVHVKNIRAELRRRPIGRILKAKQEAPETPGAAVGDVSTEERTGTYGHPDRAAHRWAKRGEVLFLSNDGYT